MQCLVFVDPSFCPIMPFFYFCDMWIPTKTCMKIPQGLCKKTLAQISWMMYFYQIWEESVSFKKKERKKQKSEIFLLLKNKSDSLAAWWETVICMAVQIFAIHLPVAWLLLFSIVPTFFCDNFFKVQLNWALQICSFAQFKNLRACLKP